MSWWDKLMGEFIDVIDWTDDSSDTLVWRFDRHNHEIKYDAKLTVRETQMAVFVNEGEIADVLGPGMYQLETRNLPILSTLQHWDHGFSSPFKAEVYFFNTKQFTDLKWGTRNPIIVRDNEFGAIRLRAFGSYAMRIEDPKKFLSEILGTDGHFTLDEITDQMRNIVVTNFSNIIANSGIPVLDLAANTEQLGKLLTQHIAPSFAEYGLSLTQILVENMSLPEAVEAAIDKRSSLGVVGNLEQYLQFQAADSLGQSGGNSGLDMGVGLAMANKMAGNLSGPETTPPPLPTQSDTSWHIAIDGKSQGPCSTADIAKLCAEGKATGDALVWHAGMADWQHLSQTELAQHLNRQIPPPLPKQ